MIPADPENLRNWVEYLALDIGRRPAVRVDLLRKVADRLTEDFISLGYEVAHQPVPYKKTHHLNIIARPKGSIDQSPGQPLLIVGAHYDTVSGSPGADDNGSAVAGLMETARLLADNPPTGLRLVAFCPEEPPAYRTKKMGSYVYASELNKHGAELKGMICLEMIGYFKDEPDSQSYPLPMMKTIYPDTGDFIAIVGNLRSIGWTKRIKKYFIQGSDLPIESLNAPSLVVGIDFSDHWSFNKFSYPAAMITDTAFYRNPHYHRMSDLPDTLDYIRAAKVVDGLTFAINAL